MTPDSIRLCSQTDDIGVELHVFRKNKTVSDEKFKLAVEAFSRACKEVEGILYGFDLYE